jgi:hypothetical protein
MQPVTAPAAAPAATAALLLPTGGSSSYSALERGLLDHEITAELLVEVSSKQLAWGRSFEAALSHPAKSGVISGGTSTCAHRFTASALMLCTAGGQRLSQSSWSQELPGHRLGLRDTLVSSSSIQQQ